MDWNSVLLAITREIVEESTSMPVRVEEAGSRGTESEKSGWVFGE